LKPAYWTNYVEIRVRVCVCVSVCEVPSPGPASAVIEWSVKRELGTGTSPYPRML